MGGWIAVVLGRFTGQGDHPTPLFRGDGVRRPGARPVGQPITHRLQPSLDPTLGPQGDLGLVDPQAGRDFSVAHGLLVRHQDDPRSPGDDLGRAVPSHQPFQFGSFRGGERDSIEGLGDHRWASF